MPRSTKLLVRLLVPAVAAAALVLPQATPTAAAEDPVAGAQTSGDVLFPNVGNGGYDVQHYDIDLAWTPGTTLVPTLSDARSTPPPASGPPRPGRRCRRTPSTSRVPTSPSARSR